MAVPVEIPPTPGQPPRGRAWWALAQVLWAPRRVLADTFSGRWVVPPYLLGTLLSLLVWYLSVRVLPGLEAAAAAGAGAGPEAGPPGMPGMPGMPGPVPMGPMGPQPLPVEQLKVALRPEFLAVAAVVAPWFGGLWRALLLHVGAALAGVHRPFARAFGLAGYSMVPLWLGQVAALGLAVALVATSPGGAAAGGVGNGGPGGPGGAAGPLPGRTGAVVVGSATSAAPAASAAARSVAVVGGAPRGVVMMAGPMGPGGPMAMGMPDGPGAVGGSDRPSFSAGPVQWTLDRLFPRWESGLGRRLLAALDFFHLWHLGLLAAGLAVLCRRWGAGAGVAGLMLVTWLLLAALQPRMPQVLTWVGVLR